MGGEFSDFRAVEHSGAAEVRLPAGDAFREGDHIVWATRGDFNFDGFACHSVGAIEVTAREEWCGEKCVEVLRLGKV